MYTRDRSLRLRERENASFPQRRRTPSFSSSLLDAIYRSIDESDGAAVESTSSHYGEPTMTKKQSISSSREEEKVSSLGRAIMIENWVEKKEKSSFGSSSSSDSSSGAVFSSSEAESSCREREKSRRRAAPVRPDRCLLFDRRQMEFEGKQQKPQREGGFTKTKLKALKIYGELKKVKQPISAGGRITNFLNSIFNANAKKVKMCSVGAMDDVSFDERKSKSTSSSATSFSRSCLSKSPSSRGNRKKRSVKFYPVSVIVDEDCRPCGHKCIYEQDPRLMPTPSVPQKTFKSSTRKDELKNFVMEKESVYLRHYQKKGKRGFHYNYNNDDDEEEDDDDASCSSSDLFELDHLIGIGRYREELPVYETTNFKTNQAITNGYMF